MTCRTYHYFIAAFNALLFSLHSSTTLTHYLPRNIWSLFIHEWVTKPTLIFIFRGFVPHEEIQFLFSLIVTMMLASLASYIRFLTWRGDRNTQKLDRIRKQGCTFTGFCRMWLSAQSKAISSCSGSQSFQKSTSWGRLLTLHLSFIQSSFFTNARLDYLFLKKQSSLDMHNKLILRKTCLPR